MTISISLSGAKPGEGEHIASAGTLDVRLASRPEEVEAVQRLRFEVFMGEMGAKADGEARIDADRFDELCEHLVVMDHAGEVPQVIGTYRLLPQAVAEANDGFYSQAEFDIEGLLARKGSDGPFLELGRSCVHPAYRNKPTIELLWRGLTYTANKHGSEVLFGCASLPGTDVDALAEPLSFLHHNCLAPEGWRVRPHENVRVETNRISEANLDVKTAFRALPPLAKGYARAGCWFSDGAYVDQEFGTTDMLIVLPRWQASKRYLARLGTGKWLTPT